MKKDNTPIDPGYTMLMTALEKNRDFVDVDATHANLATIASCAGISSIYRGYPDAMSTLLSHPKVEAAGLTEETIVNEDTAIKLYAWLMSQRKQEDTGKGGVQMGIPVPSLYKPKTAHNYKEG